MDITVVGKRGSGAIRRAATLARMIVISACRLSAPVFAQTRAGQGDVGLAATAHTPGCPNRADVAPRDGTSASCEPTEPGGKTSLRGDGYGDEDGDRPVTLVGSPHGTTAARGEIDANGEFELGVMGPMKPGLHTLVVRQGQVDPAPVEVTVRVVLAALTDRPLAWVKASASNRVLQSVWGVLGLALPAAWSLGASVGCVDDRCPLEFKVKT